ncbi:ciliary microtubule inner protein 2A-like isoform X2 [Narcine bancroftii]|uniref:ciliary microtubule inner protein 2A-like isoform X2 n=1 Tax=Narcine bancroftii TaxID=1343680 RepID=UPI003831E1B6
MTTKKHHLFTPEPHYIPGYGGYSRTFPFQFGKTYGRITHDILKDPKKSKADQSILSPMTETLDKCLPKYEENCTPDVSDQIHPQKLIPGYTGYIPQKLFNYGGNYYKETLKSGLDLQKHQMEYMQKMKEPVLISYMDGRRKLVTANENRPLKPVAANVDPETWTHLYKDKHLLATQPSDLQRRAISGYAGFIPRTSSEFAHPYQEQVKNAMDKFQRKQSLVRNKIRGYHEDDFRPNSKIYLNKPLVPNYAGHLPGWEEIRALGGNPRRHGENIQTPHRQSWI